MKKIKLYEEFIGEAYKFYDLFFNSHVDHNPECDILEGHLDKDSLITYGIYVKGPKQGLEFMEYYSGSNYKPTSDKRSNSKLFMVDKIPAKYKAMWEDLKKIYEDEYAGSGRSTRNESLVTEGQFSWMAQDTGNQIGSEKENTIAVTMFDDKGTKWLERKYDGYGKFGGKDYYELLAQMNGVENADRQDGIDIAFGKMKIKGDVLFPALIEEPNRFNFKRHDFTQEPENDPNQSWYQESDDDDEYDESRVTESHFKVGDKVKMSHGGTGVVVSLDKEDGAEDEKYYNVELPNGDMHKHSPNELTKESVVAEGKITVVINYNTDKDDLRYVSNILQKAGIKAKVLAGFDSEEIEVTIETSDLKKATKALSNNGLELQESVNEALSKEQKIIETFLNKVAKEFDYSVQDAARFVKETISKMGLNESRVNEEETLIFDEIGSELTKLTDQVIDMLQWNITDQKWVAGLKAILKDLNRVEDTVAKFDDKLGAIVYNESKVNEAHSLKESAMSDIDIIAQEAKDFKSFVKEFKKEYKNMDIGDSKELEAWLQSVYDAAKEGMDEAIKPAGAGFGAGLSKAETKKVAETYAKAISKNDGVKCTVNVKSLEEDSFDLDIDGEEYAGGSYIITLDGDVVNAALSEKPIYGQTDSTVDQIIKNLK